MVTLCDVMRGNLALGADWLRRGSGRYRRLGVR